MRGDFWLLFWSFFAGANLGIVGVDCITGERDVMTIVNALAAAVSGINAYLYVRFKL